MAANHRLAGGPINIPAGEFLMGQAAGRDEEKPVHLLFRDSGEAQRTFVPGTQGRHYIRNLRRDLLSLLSLIPIHWYYTVAYGRSSVLSDVGTRNVTWRADLSRFLPVRSYASLAGKAASEGASLASALHIAEWSGVSREPFTNSTEDPVISTAK